MARSVEDAQAAREVKLDELHDRLTGAVEQLVSGEDWARALAFAARFRGRSFANTILILTQHQEAHALDLVSDPMPSHVAGFKQPTPEPTSTTHSTSSPTAPRSAPAATTPTEAM